jgi:hypothetical protein
MSSDLRGSRRRLAQDLVLAALLVAALGCGKQGPPLPPLRAVPALTRDLFLRQQGTRVLFDMSYPKASAGGLALDGISKVEVWEIVQPSPREGKPQPLDPRVFASTAKQTFTLADADVGAATFGDHLIFSMPLPEGAMTVVPAATPPTTAPGTTTTPGTPPTAAPAPATTPPPAPRAPARFYAVRTFSKSGEKSGFSNQAILIPKPPPAAPDQLSTTPHSDGVLVEWAPVPGALGYGIYRRGAQEKGHGQPVHAAAPTEHSWLDNTARFGQSYIYAVTSFNDRDPFIESAITSEREVRYVDRFAPPAPTELVGLGETGRARLVWKASEAEDLAGYIVYRRGADGEFQRVTEQPLTTAEYIDTNVKKGETYSYRVTAIDQTGNESAPGGEVRVALP